MINENGPSETKHERTAYKGRGNSEQVSR